jgi:hypothetical protein
MYCWIDYMVPFELQDRGAVTGWFGSIDFSDGKNCLDPDQMDTLE